MKKSILLCIAAMGFFAGLHLYKANLDSPVKPEVRLQELPTANGNLPTEPTTWGERYIQDNCERCPACCVQIPAQEGAEDFDDFLDATP